MTLTAEEAEALERFIEYADVWDDGTEESVVAKAVVKVNAALASAEARVEALESELTRLDADIPALLTRIDDEAWAAVNAQSEVARLSERVAALEGALRKYGKHKPPCRRWISFENSDMTRAAYKALPCLCGLDVALGDAAGVAPEGQ